MSGRSGYGQKRDNRGPGGTPRRCTKPCRATSSGLAIPTSSASFIGGVGHHDSGADVCDSPQARTYSKSRNCRRQLTGRANAHNAPPLGLRVRTFHGGGVRMHCVVSLVPGEESGDSHHEQDAGEANCKLHHNVVGGVARPALASRSTETIVRWHRAAFGRTTRRARIWKLPPPVRADETIFVKLRMAGALRLAARLMRVRY